jgi:hypothetical protein
MARLPWHYATRVFNAVVVEAAMFHQDIVLRNIACGWYDVAALFALRRYGFLI